jgi:multidrug efflux system membrane fusion protein
VAVARKGEMDVRFTGLGTVTTLDTVTVRSRVDGQLMKLGFREGQMVHKGDLLVELDARPFQVQLMQAEGQMAKDQAALKNARADLARFSSLVAQGIVSRQVVDTQTAAVDQFEAATKVDQAAIESAKLNLSYCHITAPVSGKVGMRGVDLGNMVRASDATGIVVINPVQPINVLFTLPADQIQPVVEAVRKGASLEAVAFDRDLSDKLAVGTLESMDNQIDPATGTVRLKALFKNDDQALFPNQFVNIRLKVSTLKDAVIIPTAALQRSPQAIFLYVVKADSSVDMRTVEIQYTDGDLCAVKGGLSAGETVVTDGMEKLRPGAKVTLPGAGGGDGKPKGKGK